MDLALYTNDEVRANILSLRRDAATGQVFITPDKSTNGTWVDGKRLKKGVEGHASRTAPRLASRR